MTDLLEYAPKVGRPPGGGPARIDWKDPEQVKAYKRDFSAAGRAAAVAEKIASGVKLCPRCQVTKPFDQFEPNPKKAIGCSSHCKACKNAARANRYRNPENIDRERARARTHHKTIRQQAIEIYGGRCEHCGATDGIGGSGKRQGLEFDHIDGDGGEHRKVESHQAMMRRIVETGRPIEDRRLQILCPEHHRFNTGGMTRYKLTLLLIRSGGNDWPVVL